jgi:hypothetical protein
MKPYHIHCPFCDTRLWSVGLILLVSVAALGLFWMFVSFVLS